MKYIDLHIHSEYTKGNGITEIEALVRRAKAYGMYALALADSGTISGFPAFKKACEKYQIEPIYGCGFYLAPLGLGNQTTHHLVLLAKGDLGFKNLESLCHFSFHEGLGSKPRIDFDSLERYSKNLIALTGGLGGVFDKPFLAGDLSLANNNIEKLKLIFTNNLYLELQDNGLDNNQKIIPELTSVSKRLDIECVVTGGSFYLDPSDAARCNNVRLENGNKPLSGDGYFFKSPEVIGKIFKQYPEAVENSLTITRNILELKRV